MQNQGHLDPARSILIVEDDHTLSETVAGGLRSQGWVVRQASTCQEARSRVDDGHPAILLLDVNLPDGNGFTLLSEFRQGGLAAPVVAMSSYPVTRTELRQHQIEAFLPKPFSLQQLVATINGLFSGERQ